MKKTIVGGFVASLTVLCFAQPQSSQAVGNQTTPLPGVGAPVSSSTKAEPVKPRTVGSVTLPIAHTQPTVDQKLPTLAGKPTPTPIQASTLAQRLPPPQAQLLPGLGVMPGDINEMKVKSVRVGIDRNELVYVSLTQLNKISTPFEQPQVVDSSGAVVKAVGQDLFIQPISDKPLTIYITDGGIGQSVGLTLVPKPNLPAQSIVLQPETSPTKSMAVGAKTDDYVPSDYVGKLTAHFKQLALGKTPNGFTKGRLPRAVAANAQTVYEPLYKYAGSSYDIYSYKIRSISETPIELNEESFYTAEVRAVAFYPLAMLQKDEETTVFVISDHIAKDAK